MVLKNYQASAKIITLYLSLYSGSDIKTNLYAAFRAGCQLDSKHRYFEKKIEEGNTTYYVTKKKTKDTIVLQDDENLPSGSLRAKPFSINFIKKHMYSKVHIKASDIRKLVKFSDEFEKY